MYKTDITMGIIEMIKGRKQAAPDPPLRTAKDLEFAFKDTAGVRYYRINTQLGVGLEHYGKAMEFTMWMAAGLQPTELNSILDVMEQTLEKLIEGKKGNLATLGWAINEIRLRQQMVIHTELLYQYIACHYIREDEPLTEWIERIHNEKVEAFKECVKTQTAYDFFQLPELRNLTGISSMSQQDWTKHWNDSIREQEALVKKVQYLRSELKSASVRKTERKAS